MLDFKDLPFAEGLGPVALAGAAGLGAHYIVVAPELGKRLSDLQYRPQCLASVEALSNARRSEHEAERRAIDARRRAIIAKAERANEAARQKIAGTRAAAGILFSGPLGGLMDSMTPSGNFQRDVMAMVLSVPEIDLDALDLPELPSPLPEATPETRAEYCGCIAARGTDQERLAFTFYSSSLTAYTPPTVTGFDDVLPDWFKAAPVAACRAREGGKNDRTDLVPIRTLSRDGQELLCPTLDFHSRPGRGDADTPPVPGHGTRPDGRLLRVRLYLRALALRA